ncbi:MAG: hypothetical protein K2Y23_16790 [Cyanobacteria bacterium]|nr:hypothetical protein [Cyanobacteriota bacterium]
MRHDSVNAISEDVPVKKLHVDVKFEHGPLRRRDRLLVDNGIEDRHRLAETQNPIVQARECGFALIHALPELNQWIDGLRRKQVAALNQTEPGARQQAGRCRNLDRTDHVVVRQIVDELHVSARSLKDAMTIA